MESNFKKQIESVLEQYIDLQKLFKSVEKDKELSSELEKYEEYLNYIKKREKITPRDLKKAYILYIDILESYVDLLKRYRKEIITIIDALNHVLIEIKATVASEEKDIFEDVDSILENAKKRIKYARTKNKSIEEISEDCTFVVGEAFENIKELDQLINIKTEFFNLKRTVNEIVPDNDLGDNK